VNVKGVLQNRLQFSVVREDPSIEIQLFKKFKVKTAALIGSGGCSALSLITQFPNASILLIEPNSAQIKLIKEKISRLQSKPRPQRLESFGVSRLTNTNKQKLSLIERGNFEALFRCLREFLFQFVAPKTNFARLLIQGNQKDWEQIFSHPYWPVAFELHFSNSLLNTMFGPQATQHATPESYPQYFRLALERGLLRRDRAQNYFLHHIFLGHYLPSKKAWPVYLQTSIKSPRISFFNGKVQDLNDFSRFDFIGLSNIFDWSDEDEVKLMAKRLSDELPIGACVLYRQLNNRKNFERLFGENFRWHQKLAREHLKKDRSLFYSSLHLGEKIR